MRNDLTANFLSKMASNVRRPIQYMQIYFSHGTIYISDRDIVVDGIHYEGIVEDWGSINTVGAENAVSGTLEMSVSIWNGGPSPFYLNFMREDPVNVFANVYQSFEGLNHVDFAKIGEFVIQDPIEYAESDSLIKIELVSSNMRYFGQVGELVTKSNYPYAIEADLNKSIDLIVGDAGRVQCLCIDSPPRATLDGSILKSTRYIDTVEDLDELGFYQSGTIQIDDEVISYLTRTSNRFNVQSRGIFDGTSITIASSHSDGSQVIQAGRPVVYLIGQGPLESVSNIKVGGKNPSITPTIDINSNPATITFAKQPTYTEMFNNTSGNVKFNTVNLIENTAKNASNSFDEDAKSEGAVLDPNFNKLAIYHSGVEEDKGELVNIFLNVTHWATDIFVADFVRVWIRNGSNQWTEIGILTRPNLDDSSDLQPINLNLNHTHGHKIGGFHNHSKTDATYGTADVTGGFGGVVTNQVIDEEGIVTPTVQATDIGTGHEHSATITNNKSNGMTPFERELDFYPYGTQEIHTANFYVNPVDGKTLNSQFSCNLNFIGKIYVYYIKVTLYGSFGSFDNYISVNSWDYSYDNVPLTLSFPGWLSSYTNVQVNVNVQISAYSSSVASDGRLVKVSNPLLTWNKLTTSVDNENPTLSTQLDTSSEVLTQTVDTSGSNINSADDVEETTIDVVIDDTEVSSSTKEITDSFDITDFVQDADWDWFTNREVQLTIHNPSGVDVYITYVDFEIEYRERQIKATDDITCEVIGSIESRPDAVIQHLLNEKAGLPLSKFSSVYREVPVWDDANIWTDTSIWSDEGQVTGVPVGAAFEEAAAWFSYHNYRIDGVISGSLTIKDAIEELTWQSRSKILWQHGTAQLSINRKTEDWQIARDLDINEIQLMSYKANRSSVSDIVNKIDLFYTIDRLSEAEGSGQYDASASVQDNTSIQKHGERVDDAKWLFHLVRSADMAESLADYYLWLLGETSTFYTLSTYLNNFDLEKEDYITINSYKFAFLYKLPVVIKELVREFGSGKLKKINLLKLTAQSIRHYFHIVDAEDIVECVDALRIELGLDADLEDIAGVQDFLELTWNKYFEDNVNVSEYLEIVANYAPDFIDNIIANSELSLSMHVALEDSVLIGDNLIISEERCFGSCGFGGKSCELPFGAKTIHKDSTLESLQFTDIVSIAMNVGLTESVNVTDELLFSDGFGCPAGLGEGMGESPFGC